MYITIHINSPWHCNPCCLMCFLKIHVLFVSHLCLGSTTLCTCSCCFGGLTLYCFEYDLLLSNRLKCLKHSLIVGSTTTEHILRTVIISVKFYQVHLFNINVVFFGYVCAYGFASPVLSTCNGVEIGIPSLLHSISSVILLQRHTNIVHAVW